MASVPQRNTKPELAVRRILHALGFRFRLHRGDLPGSPDIVLPRHRVVVFVHGCFWHQHEGCKKARRPSSNADYWDRKLDDNIERDRRSTEALQELGWRVLLVWQCELRDSDSLAKRLAGALHQ